VRADKGVFCTRSFQALPAWQDCTIPNGRQSELTTKSNVEIRERGQFRGRSVKRFITYIYTHRCTYVDAGRERVEEGGDTHADTTSPACASGRMQQRLGPTHTHTHTHHSLISIGRLVFGRRITGVGD